MLGLGVADAGELLTRLPQTGNEAFEKMPVPVLGTFEEVLGVTLEVAPSAARMYPPIPSVVVVEDTATATAGAERFPFAAAITSVKSTRQNMKD